uniref:Uncharacterized protein n=1 Tax=Romanomermis culicivorax TaxID=13658 RepID=A0A915KM90_ROMCU
MTGDISMVALYRPKKTATVTAAVAVAPGPRAGFAAHKLPPGIPTDSMLEVIRQMESMNLIDSLSITNAMWAIWSTELAKKYPHLP